MDERQFVELVEKAGLVEIESRGRTTVESFDLNGLTLVEPDLRQFDFVGGKLTDVVLIRPLLDDACFKDGTLENVRIVDGRLRRLKADHVTWEDCRLSGCELDGSEFCTASTWRRVYADGIQWNGGKFTDSSWTDCNLSGASFSNLDARSLIVRNCRLARTRFSKVDLRAATFEPADLKTASLSDIATTLRRFKDDPDPRFRYFASAKGDSLIPPDEQAPS